MNDKYNNEINPDLPDLDKKRYDHWRDWADKLANGKTKLPNITNERSKDVGSFLYSIGQRTILNLREDRLDSNGNPYILCEDEVSDQEVLSSAKKEDIQKSFIRAFISESRAKGIEVNEEMAIDYSTAASTLALVMFDSSLAQTVGLLSSSVESMLPNNKLGQALQKSISGISPNKVKQVVDYLKFSQTQLVKNEELFLKTGLKVEPQVDSTPFYLEGKEHVVSSSLRGSVQIDSTLDEGDKELLIPLKGANHRSRIEMVEQAKLLAKQIFNINIDSQPPAWWMKKRSLSAIRSDEYLVYKPIIKPEEADLDIPHIFKYIESVDDRPGWYIIKSTVSKSDGSLFISEAARIVS